MIKLPEPATVTVLQSTPYYTEAQLKQYGRDLLEQAAQVCDGQINNANQLSKATETRKASDIWSAVAQTAHASSIAIRALIKEIPE